MTTSPGMRNKNKKGSNTDALNIEKKNHVVTSGHILLLLYR